MCGVCKKAFPEGELKDYSKFANFPLCPICLKKVEVADGFLSGTKVIRTNEENAPVG